VRAAIRTVLRNVSYDKKQKKKAIQMLCTVSPTFPFLELMRDCTRSPPPNSNIHSEEREKWKRKGE
jgi:hypothetical protein